MIDLAVSLLLAHQPIPDDMKIGLIEDYHPLALRIGHNIAYRTGNDIEEYRSAAVQGLVRAANRLDHTTCPRPENEGVVKYLMKSTSGFTYNFMRRDRVVYNYDHEYVDMVPDDYIDLLITDVHDFLDDLVSLVTDDPNVKNMLYAIGRGETTAKAAQEVGLSKMQASRLLKRIRTRYQSQL